MAALDKWSPGALLGIGALIGMVIVVLVFVIWRGIRSEWKFKCYQRLPMTGQSWDNAK